MQAIITKYLGPTDHRGSRVKATCQAGSLTLEWDDTLDLDANHRVAAIALAEKLGWTGAFYGDLISGGMPDGNDCHVFSNELKLARLCREWASEGRDHGGNPEFYPFVKLANKILGL